MKLLYVNASVRDESRTDQLARKLLEKYGVYDEVKLNDEEIAPLRKQALENRTDLIDHSDYQSEIFQYAKQFAEADIIVVSAPYWDLAFPSLLKIYLENVYVTGLVSRYGEDGKPEGLCKAKMLYYVATAGGPFDKKYSYDYVRELAMKHFGVRDTRLIVAEMLDIQGYDAKAIMSAVMKEIEGMETIAVE